MIISHNIPAMRVNNSMKNNVFNSSKNLNKLSSGLRINSAADDAAGLGISEQMRAQIRGLGQASRNAQDGISLVQTAEGALGSIGDQLQRINELAVQAANGILTDNDRKNIQEEVARIKESIDQIASNTQFNGINVLDGSLAVSPEIPPSSSIDVTTGGLGKTIDDGDIPIGTSGAVVRLNPDEFIQSDNDYGLSINWVNGAPSSFNIHKRPDGEVVVSNWTEPTYSVNGITFDVSGASSTGSGTQAQGVIVFHPGNNSLIPEVDNSLILQIGANAGQTMAVDIDSYSTKSLQIHNLAVDPREKALEAIRLAKSALDKVVQGRSQLGASQNRLDHVINNVNNYQENLTAAESRIRDADIAKEMMQLTKNNILTQASQAMMAQANSSPQSILSMLK